MSNETTNPEMDHTMHLQEKRASEIALETFEPVATLLNAVIFYLKNDPSRYPRLEEMTADDIFYIAIIAARLRRALMKDDTVTAICNLKYELPLNQWEYMEIIRFVGRTLFSKR